MPLGVGTSAARSQTLIYTANQSQWRSVEGDRAFKLVEVSRLRSSSNTLPRLGYAAVNCSADASAATAIDQSFLRSRIHGVPETIALALPRCVSFRPRNSFRLPVGFLFQASCDTSQQNRTIINIYTNIYTNYGSILRLY